MTQFSGQLNLSPLERIRLAATEKTTQDVLGYMARPDPDTIGDNKRYYFALTHISAAPGWCTESGYAAEVDVFVEYADMDYQPNARVAPKVLLSNTKDGGRLSPQVVGVYPLMEAQVLDLRHSLRRQLATARLLGASGFGLGFQQLNDFLATAERDAQTLTSAHVTIATSHSGESFGFRIEPQYRAITDQGGNLANPGTAGSRVFNPVSFPAVVVVVVNKDDLAASPGGLHYDHMVFHINSRWAPMSGVSRRYTEVDFAERVDAWSAALATFAPIDQTSTDPHLHDPHQPYGSHRMAMRRRLMMYEHRGLGTSAFVRIPDRGQPPAVPSVTPWVVSTKGWINRDTAIVIEGDHLTPGNVHSVLVGGVAAPILNVSRKAIVAVVPPLDPKATAEPTPPKSLSVEVVTSAGLHDAGCFEFERLHPAAIPSGGTPPVADAQVVISRDDEGFITEFKLLGQSHERTKEVLTAIRGLLRDGSMGTFDLRVDAQGGVSVDSSSGETGESGSASR